jgi:hypothetical protein
MNFLRVTILCLSVATASAFAPVQSHHRTDTTLNVIPGGEALLRKSIASFAAGAVILSNVVIATPSAAGAYDGLDFGTSQVIAARSGGRAGGRSSSYKAPPAQRSAAASRPDPVIIRETRIIAPTYSSGTAVMMPPPMYMAPQPSFPGLGLVAGVSAINAIGDGMREARQENEIRDARAAVTEARIKEAELEARLKSLEQQQNRQYVPPPMQYAPAPVAP